MSAVKYINVNKKIDSISILNDINFEINKGAITGLIGKNGAGKTTIINCLTAFDFDYNGEIRFSEIIKSEIYTKISYIPDKPVYYEELTVMEHIKFISVMNQTESKVSDLIAAFNLVDYLNHFPSELSKGTLQRLMIILALLKDFSILIADEPFSGLDPSEVFNLQNELKKIKAEGKTILVSSHQLAVVQRICDNYILIDKGRVVHQTQKGKANENIEELYSNLIEDLRGVDSEL